MESRQAIAEAFDPSRWSNWFNSLEPSFVFLLCLPFAVAAAGLLADVFRKRLSVTSATESTVVDHGGSEY